MSRSERFSLRPSPEEWRRDWIARGELCDQRFELPPGVSSVIFDHARLVNVRAASRDRLLGPPA
ncbi:hypothetical protein [Microbispora bryophytorum]|uniref:Uncharacterized protein n=1 Tax=Microbispora bryophytorum subsp. camponoti TaxID=1677852 RepID=A0ABR8L9X1_9ACTN|nr:hypothetical protein [Microbispora camponoti]MBD3146802.1 hypothetical protein [Microbispora camponoti]